MNLTDQMIVSIQVDMLKLHRTTVQDTIGPVNQHQIKQ
jgi:hypothetical protein